MGVSACAPATLHDGRALIGRMASYLQFTGAIPRGASFFDKPTKLLFFPSSSFTGNGFYLNKFYFFPSHLLSLCRALHPRQEISDG